MKPQAKTSILLVFFLFSLFINHYSFLSAQAPQKFNYQAVARNGNAILENTILDVKFEILQGSTSGTMVWTETQTGVTTNDYGLFSIQAGSENEISIDWNDGPYFLKVQVDIGTGFQDFGNSELLSVPYALNTQSVSSLEKLDIQGPADMDPDSALFEVKRNDGQTVFAVYNSGVRIFVEEEAGKGSKGGFAIGGFTPGKAETGEYFRVTPDSVRIYLDSTTAKSRKGGFAIGGFTPGKAGEEEQFFSVSTANEASVINPSQARILWYPYKEAFLAGRVLVESPDSVGTNSVATGFESKAIGDYSQALGYQSRAYGDYSTAIGRNSQVTGNSSFAFGYRTFASGTSSLALGDNAKASGYKSYALGYLCTASGLKSYAIGSQNRAVGEVSYAIGHHAAALNNSSMAFGRNAQASGYHSIAIGVSDDSGGYWTDASGSKSIAIGSNCKSKESGSTTLGFWLDNNDSQSTVVGKYNFPAASGTVLLVGNGTSSTNRSNAMTVYENGNVTIAGTLAENSDIRLKTNISSLENVLETLMEINVVSYEFKDTSTHPFGRQIGLIAQEIEPLYPELVSKNNTGVLSLNYSKLSVLLLEGMQEQQETIEYLKAEIDKLKSEKSELALLKEQMRQLQLSMGLLGSMNDE